MKRILFSFILSFTVIFFAASFNPAANTGIVEDVLNYTNEFRTSKGLGKLSSNAILNNIAQQHSENMASGKVKFGHDGFSKRYASAQQQLAVKYVAENVAFGVFTGQDAVNLWKNSDGHRKNMLGSYARIGIGIAKDKQGHIFYTQLFSD